MTGRGGLLAVLRRTRKDESGFSLAELLVAIMVLGFLLAMSAGILAWVGNSVRITQGTAAGAGTASDVMDEISTVVRSGTNQPVVNQLVANPPFIQATSESVTMYAYVDSYTSPGATTVRPQIVQFSLNSQRQLIEKRWVPTSTSGTYFTFPTFNTTVVPATTSTAPSSTKNFGGPLLTTPTGSNPLFVYLTSTCSTPSDPTTCGVVSPTTTTAQMLTIASIEVTVRVQGATKAARPSVVLQNVVNIPNIDLTGN
jgi:prepilin-type N-terminal cleavage/methylation domain-containing protein